jgi:hypothetical protein
VIKEPGTGINFAPAVNSSSAFALVLTKLHEQEESHLEPVMTN